MKNYTFSKVSARGYLTKADLENRWIITDDLKLVINLSEKCDEDAARLLEGRGISYIWLPLLEETEDIGYDAILKAVDEMLKHDESGDRMIVHCDFGNNRSRTVVEAFHFAKMGFHLEDEYKGFQNHLIYNSESGFLPPIRQIEIDLQELSEDSEEEAEDAYDIWNNLHRTAFEVIYKEGAREYETFKEILIDNHWADVEDCYDIDQVDAGLADLWEYGDYEHPETKTCMRYHEWAEFFSNTHAFEIYGSFVDAVSELKSIYEDYMYVADELKSIIKEFCDIQPTKDKIRYCRFNIGYSDLSEMTLENWADDILEDIMLPLTSEEYGTLYKHYCEHMWEEEAETENLIENKMADTYSRLCPMVEPFAIEKWGEAGRLSNGARYEIWPPFEIKTDYLGSSESMRYIHAKSKRKLL